MIDSTPWPESDADGRDNQPDAAEHLHQRWQQGQRPDVGTFLAGFGPLPPAEVAAVLRVDQGHRWQRGEQILAEAYLLRHADVAAHVECALDLIYSEYLLRERSGEDPNLDDFLARFPEHAAVLRMQVELHQAIVLCRGAIPDPAAQASVSGPTVVHANPGVSAPRDPFTLAGYQIVRELGRGGMGVVYQAYDPRRKEMVALKTMQQLEAATLYRFKREFRALADVTHPNLVALYELMAEENKWFFTMELVEGVDFLTYVRAGVQPANAAEDDSSCISCQPGRLAPDQLDRLRRALRQLAHGVAALHEAGKLHRDIKPTNVLVTNQDRVVLLDFGLAAELAPTGQPKSSEPDCLGTAAYMAPEQAAGLPASPVSDWYSVGVMLYEALTHRLPFAGNSLKILLDKQTRDPPAPADLVRGVPADLNTCCLELLRRDPAARPPRQEILRRLGDAPAGPEVPVYWRPSEAARIPLIGRERDLQALTAAFSCLQQGRTVALFVQGRSGVGKSVLVQHFLDGLEKGGEVVVLAGRCYERESVPYKALDSLVDALSRYLRQLRRSEARALLPRDVHALARMFLALRDVEVIAQAPQRALEVADQQEQRRRAFVALRELLARLGHRKPLVLFIDDLHWGDVDSAALLTELLRPPDPPRLLLVGCYRSEDALTSPFLRTLFQSWDQTSDPVDRRELTIEPLTQTEARALALTLLHEEAAAAPAQAEAIARESGGNPFFIYELVHYAQACAGLPGGSSGTAAIALDKVLGARILRLPEAGRRLLQVVAVAGQPLRMADACLAADLGAEERAALAVLRSGRLLRGSGLAEQDEVETYHDRIRETVVALLTPLALEHSHRRLAWVLEGSGQADPEVLAVHFLGANEPARAGVYYAFGADRAAEKLAFDRAGKLYQLALQLQRDESPQRRGLRAKLGDALANAGRGPEAAKAYLAAAEGVPPAEAVELQSRAAMQFLISGHVDDGLAVLRTVLRAVGMKLPGSPRRALWSLLVRRALLWLRGLRFRERAAGQVPAAELTRIDTCWSVAAGLSIIDPIRASDFQARHLLGTLHAGEPSRIARALAMEAVQVSIVGGRSRRRAEGILQTAEALAQRVSSPYALGSVALAKGSSAYFAGRWKMAAEWCDQAETVFRDHCTGVAWELDIAHTFALTSLMYMGEVAELSRRLPVLLAEAQERGDRFALTNLKTYVLPFLRLAADDPERARREPYEALGEWSQKGFHVQHLTGVFAQVHIDLYCRQGQAAWQHITEQWPAAKRSLVLRVQRMRVYYRYLHACSALAAAVAGAQAGPLLHTAAQDARQMEHEREPWSEALARLVRAGVAAFRGDTPSAVALLVDAAARLEAADMRLWAAATRRRQGQLVGGDAGCGLVAQADSWMMGQGVKDPARMTAMYAPGFLD